MTVIVAAQSTLIAEASAVSLARYAAIIQYPECAFWSVIRDGDVTGECRELWSKMQRDNIARSLAEAQEELETEIGYFLSPRYVVGALADHPSGQDKYVDDQMARNPIRTRWPRIIARGIRATATIQAGAAVSHAADPALITVIGVTVTDIGEVYVYHPGTDIEINPSSMAISGGTLTIRIPRCRMVTAALADPDEGLDYANPANFEATVDVTRVYTSDAENADLVTTHMCDEACHLGGCGEYVSSACIYISDPRRGIISIAPATYVDGAWNSGGICRSVQRVRLNYLAGMKALTRQAEDAIVRLAHSKMPSEPCGCEVSKFVWKRDRHTPDILTRERINSRFGMSDGAWAAWEFAQDMKQWRGSTL